MQCFCDAVGGGGLPAAVAGFYLRKSGRIRLSIVVLDDCHFIPHQWIIRRVDGLADLFYRIGLLLQRDRTSRDACSCQANDTVEVRPPRIYDRGDQTAFTMADQPDAGGIDIAPCREVV